jgi:hypothetical protein
MIKASCDIEKWEQHMESDVTGGQKVYPSKEGCWQQHA